MKRASLSDDDTWFQDEWKKEESDVHTTDFLPVFHKCIFKGIHDEDSGLKLRATFVQHVIQYHKGQKTALVTKKSENKGQDDKKKEIISFVYRVNGTSDVEKHIQVRNEKKYNYQSKGGSLTCFISTFDVFIPLDVTSIFNGYPYTISKAETFIELSSFVEGSVTYRPNLAINPDDLKSSFVIDDVEEFDMSKDFDLVTPCPQIQYFSDKDDSNTYCHKFSISFTVEDNGLVKFIKFSLPLFVVCIISTWNVCISGQNRSDYLGNASNMALALVFSLHEIEACKSTTFHITINTAIIFLSFLGLAMASFPPYEDIAKIPCKIRLFFHLISHFGIALLWLSFAISVYNFYAYYSTKQTINGEAANPDVYTRRKDVKGKWRLENSLKTSKFVTDVFEDSNLRQKSTTEEIKEPQETKVRNLTKFRDSDPALEGAKDDTKGFLFRQCSIHDNIESSKVLKMRLALLSFFLILLFGYFYVWFSNNVYNGFYLSPDEVPAKNLGEKIKNLFRRNHRTTI